VAAAHRRGDGDPLALGQPAVGGVRPRGPGGERSQIGPHLLKQAQDRRGRRLKNLARLARLDPKLLYPLRHRGEESQAHIALIRSRQVLIGCRTQLVNPGYEGLSQVLRGPPAQVPCQELPQEGRRAHLGGAFGGARARLGADRFAHRAHPRIRPAAGGDLRGPLPGDRTVEAGRGDRAANEKSRSVGAYLGLVPATDRSGDSDPQKRISKEGDEMLSVSFWWAAPTTSWVPSDPTRISGATEKR
jgi:transposase